MDNLVLIRVAASLAPRLEGGTLAEIREESPFRLRLMFEREGRFAALCVSLDPVLPWIGTPCVRKEGPRRAPGPFAPKATRALHGLRLLSVKKAAAERVVTLHFADGQTLVIELATHAANLIHVDSAGRTMGSARHPRKTVDRIAPGQPYLSPLVPAGKFVPFGATPREIDRFLAGAAEEGEDLFEALRRRIFGIGTGAAGLVVTESRLTGRTPGDVMASRLALLEAGELEPVIEGSQDPLAEAAAGTLDPATLRLFPWEPPEPAPGATRSRGNDAAATAGLYHEAIEKTRRVAARNEALRAIVRGEIRRLWEAEKRMASDLEGLGDPDVSRRSGEALLAGIGRARRVGDHVWVPDPYDADGSEIEVAAPAGRTLQVAADEHFQRSRRARRGREMTGERLTATRSRLRRFERIQANEEGGRDEDTADRIEAALRAEGIPIGIGQGTRAGRVAARAEPPRVEGVRLLMSRDGFSILIGRTGKDNDRLTFKLAGPEDFWLHAAGVPGAHVIVRNPGRVARPPRTTLEEAATAAAWFSDAREAGQADVQWTRRKNVRRLRGAPPGTVTLKRFETLRVRPAPPAGSDSPSR
jgi:predicted ribosome quality control (RQC) complex YloA/Tae2 family protein